MGKLVVDTNALLQCIASRNQYHDLWVSLFDGRNNLCITNEILQEYEEVLELRISRDFAKRIIEKILYNDNTLLFDPYFKFNLIQADPDDNKFVDCAICADAKFIVTEDRHFQILKEIEFPKVEIITLDEIIKQI